MAFAHTEKKVKEIISQEALQIFSGKIVCGHGRSPQQWSRKIMILNYKGKLSEK
jgi:hypothetical protein